MSNRETDTPLPGVAPGVAPGKVVEPRQGWAHEDGIVALRENQPVTPGQPIDRLMIHETFARWGIAWDEGCLEVIRSLFLPEGELTILEGSATPIASLVGHEPILDHVRKSRAVQADQRRHAMSNIVIEELSATTATALAYGLVSTIRNGEMILAATVIYRAELVKDELKGWQYKRFVIGMDAYLRR